ncbi:hypothetical protein LZG04_18235 [Saccharothrix sp. S26]|uniref:hypothetical protein n=1 Tax=Saccharothrix sp. S26 TaxID=2907215 RepID=UPI001F386EC5|nr:hypothetical protein [Saccharothrix sp. S26]MCE6996728.1 hypothetical protein [Saccharothrix sp. S26]
MRRASARAGWPLREPFPHGAVLDALRTAGDYLGRVSLSPVTGVLRPLVPELACPMAERLAGPSVTGRRVAEAAAVLGVPATERLLAEVGAVAPEQARAAPTGPEWQRLHLRALRALDDVTPRPIHAAGRTQPPRRAAARLAAARRGRRGPGVGGPRPVQEMLPVAGEIVLVPGCLAVARGDRDAAERHLADCGVRSAENSITLVALERGDGEAVAALGGPAGLRVGPGRSEDRRAGPPILASLRPTGTCD